MRKAPAFQFYAADFIVGTLAMTPEQVGGYIRLLCYQWEHGPIPDDQELLCRITGCSPDAVASIRHKFGIAANGALANERLESVRSQQEEYRKKQADRAVSGWEKRKANGSAMPTHMPESCSPTPTSSSKDKEPALPEVLDSDEFRKAWADYEAHRRELRLRKLKAKSVEAQWREMAGWGLPVAIESIRNTIRNGWQGLFHPQAKSATGKPAPVMPPRPAVKVGAFLSDDN